LDFFSISSFNTLWSDIEESQLIIQDILETEEYTLQGISFYTDIPVDVINELASGINIYPSFILFRKILELHKSVRRDIYDAIRQKIISKFSSQS